MCCFFGDRSILWYNIYDSLMFVGLKLSNREDSEIKKNLIVFHAYMYSTFSMSWVRHDIMYRCMYMMMYHWLIPRVVWKEKKKKGNSFIKCLDIFTYRDSAL